jgi:hypothetical protein
MYLQQFVDPQRIEIKPPAWRLLGFIVGILVFSVAGGIIAVVSDNIVDRVLGIVAVIFFGLGGALWLIKSRRREHLRVAVAPSGFEIYIVGVGWRTIPWRDIEAFSVVKHGSSELTAVRLRHLDSLLASITPAQARAVMRWLPALQIALHGTAGLAAASGDFENAAEMAGVGTDVYQMRSLEDALRVSRDRFGGEFLLPWSARDRSANAFAQFLDDYRRRYT